MHFIFVVARMNVGQFYVSMTTLVQVDEVVQSARLLSVVALPLIMPDAK
jgi:hypothetical protein